MNFDTECVIRISAALLTPLIAIVASYIAYQQLKANSEKVKLDKFDRRFRIYEELEKILIIIRGGEGATYDQLTEFRRSVAQADFLFGPEIGEYLKEIYDRGINLRYWTEQYRDQYQEKPEGYDHSKVVESKHIEIIWLTEQLEKTAKAKFKKYLDLSR